MVKIKVFRDSIEIKCKSIVPYHFKYKFLSKLAFYYILKSEGETIFKINKNKITEDEKKEFLKFYEQNNFVYTFEEFIELTMFPIGALEIYTKDNDKIAFIDFMPDGDVCSIWMDIYNMNYKQRLLDLIKDVV